MTGYLTTLAKLGQDATPGPWPTDFVYEAVRHVRRNCDFIESTSDPDFNWDDIPDSTFIAVSRDVWDEMVTALRAADEKHHGVQWEESPSGMTMEFHRDDNGASCLCGRIARDCTELVALKALKAKVESL